MSLSTDLTSIQSALTRYVLPICFALGVIGNFLNILVFTQRHLRTNSCSVYFISTSFFNCLVMFFGIVPIVYTSYSSYDYASYSISYCKFRSYIVHVLLMISRFSVALASIDRFALCSPNLSMRSLNQRHIAIKLVFFICLLWFVIPTHMLVYVTIQMPSRRCGGTGNYSVIYGIYSAVVTAIPLFIMIIFSYLAMKNLLIVRSRVRPSVATDNANGRLTVRIKKRDTQYVILLISEVIIYFLSTVLFPVYSIYIAITASVSKGSDRVAIEGSMRYLTLNFFLYINSCSIFYVHLLASKAFRQECKLLLFGFPRSNRVIPIDLSVTRVRNGNNQLKNTHTHHPMSTSFKRN